MQNEWSEDMAHEDIHNVLIKETNEWRNLMKQLLSKLEHEALIEEMQSFITYVEDEVLKHENAQEAPGGLYKTIVQEKPELQEKVHHLTRDHQLMRIIIDLMKKELANDEIDFQKLVDYSSTITLLNEIHSKDEEESLLKDD